MEDRPILKLNQELIGKIAAGEVVESPASAIKELVENSLDAGATCVTVEIRDGGIAYLRVTDNGRGIRARDVRMAFERHATSKITKSDDLFALHTLGFRGEALASICAVARVEVRTKTKDAAVGTRLVINGSEVESQKPESAATGTNMQVKNLFYNVPARRKFLKKDAVEMAAITREFERLALVNTGIDFTLIHNDVTIFSLRRSTELRRIADLFGIQLIHIDCMTVSGEFAQHKAYLGMKRYLEENDGQPGFTAVYAVAGESVPGIMSALREFGCELPRDISIMAHSTEQIGRYYHPALTAVCVDLGAEVEAVFSGLASILDRQAACFQTEVPMKLVERDSVRKLTPNERI